MSKSIDELYPNLKLNKGFKENMRAGGYLYPNPRYNPINYRPRWYAIGDTNKVVNGSVRTDHIRFGRELFATLPSLGAAIIDKNSWAFNEGWMPRFQGANKEWGDEVEDWLKNIWFPNCNVLGSNYDWTTTLYTSGLSLDIDGDTMMLMQVQRDGFPKLLLVPSHRIGQRENKGIVEGGRYDGYSILDGVILDKNKKPVAYRILGDVPADDYDCSVKDCQLLMEPEWQDMYRGVSRIARSVFDLLDVQDIDEFLKRAVKLSSTVGLLHTTETGTPDTGAPIVAAGDDPLLQEMGMGMPSNLNVESINQGEIYYLRGLTGEKLEPWMDERPSPNTEAFIARLEQRALKAVGWFRELMEPSDLGPATTRLINAQARQSVRARQHTIQKRAKLAVAFAVQKAMQGGFIPENWNDQWWKWHFTKGPVLSIDSINEEASDRENLKMGTTTLSHITSKQGHYWQDVVDQRTKELEYVGIKANELSKLIGITPQQAMDMIYQRTPNGMTNASSVSEDSAQQKNSKKE